MQVHTTNISDVLILEPKVFGDDRGFFLESWNQQTLKDSFNELIDKLIPISKKLGCNKELESLVDLVNNNKAPYNRQLDSYRKLNDLNLVIKESISELKESLNGY